MPSLSWDGMAGEYDETRKADERCFETALDHLLGEFPREDFTRIVEPGIGNGRIAIPLARRGYHVSGVDISREMLDALRMKVRGTELEGRIEAREGDATALPWPDGAFDLAVVSHLFWFVEAWKQAVRELRRVLKPAGPVALLNTGTGMEIPRLNDRYKALCAQAGWDTRSPGASSTRDVVDHLAGLGYRVEETRDRWQWTASVVVAAALGHIERRAYSFTKMTPDDVHGNVVAALRAECSKGPVREEIPNQITVFVARPAVNVRGSRPRACGALIRDGRVLMVRHLHHGRDYWTLPGGAIETGETFEQAAEREMEEETGIRARAGKLLFAGTYLADGSADKCFLMEQADAAQRAALGADPEEAPLAPADRMLKEMKWWTIEEMREDPQIAKVRRALGIP